MAEGGISDFDKEAPESVIISGVIDGVKQSFIDSGVDLDVLNKLQDLWVSKLKANSSQGLSIADVIQPAPVKKELRKKRKVKTEGRRGNSRVKVEEEEMEDAGEIGQGSGEKQKTVTEQEEIIVISSDEEATGSISFKMPQVDGPADSSDDDGVDDDDDDGEDDEGVEEEPLGSEDDISDEDASDLFDTENVVVCQYDKITRARNKWKFHLKD